MAYFQELTQIVLIKFRWYDGRPIEQFANIYYVRSKFLPKFCLRANTSKHLTKLNDCSIAKEIIFIDNFKLLKGLFQA